MIAWYGRILHGDLGQSILLNRSVTAAIIERLPVTLSLTALALAFAMVLGIVAGLLAAMRHRSWTDQSIMVLALLGLSVPEFWLGLMLIFGFAVDLRWFPAGGYVPLGESFSGWWHSMAMPAFTLAAVQVGFIARMTRSAMLEVLHQDFIRTADSKGLPWSIVVTRHGLPNALVPILTVIGIVTGGVAGWRSGHRAGVLAAWGRSADHRRRAEPRLPGDPGDLAVRRGDLPAGQPGGRYPLRRGRSAGAP